MENEISRNDIVAIRNRLKRLDKNWAADLAVKMASDFPKINSMKVYNIVNNQLKHQQHRRSFVLHAGKLLAEYEKRQEKVAIKVEQLLEEKTT